MTANTDTESIVNEPGRGFLDHLASSIQRYPYRGRQQLLVDFEAELDRHRAHTSGHVSEWFLLIGVDETIFTSKFLDPVNQNTPWTSWISYDAHLQLLLVRTTKSAAHETASMIFHNMLLEAVEPTGLKRCLGGIGSATHFASLDAKEPDQAWRPHRILPGRSQDWLSLVMEIACSEAESRLGSDVCFSMQASGGDVKAVLTLCVNRQQPEIKIEKWASKNSNNNRHHLGQSVTISKQTTIASYYPMPRLPLLLRSFFCDQLAYQKRRTSRWTRRSWSKWQWEYGMSRGFGGRGSIRLSA